MKRFHFALLLVGALFFSACGSDDNAKDDNPYAFKDYISYTTTNRQSVTDPITIELAKPLEQFEANQKLSEDFIDISPGVDGQLSLKNTRTLVFKPKHPLDPDTEYTVSVHLDKLYDGVKDKFKTYTFSFKTIAPNFKIDLGNLQSYNKTYQYVEGTLESADYIQPEKLQQLISVTQDGKRLPVKFEEAEKNARYFRFKIDSIHRKKEDSNIHISWNGEPIKSKTKGENDFKIPGQDNFKIVDLNTTPAPKAALAINFSDPIDPDQDFSGLVQIEKIHDLRFEVDGNVLHVYPGKRVTGKVKVSVFKGIKNTSGFALKTKFSELVAFHQIKPAVKLISKGVILPSAQSTPLYFKAVNLSAVDVRVIKIYEDNMLQFLQTENLNSDAEHSIRRVGRRVAKKTIPLNVDKIDKGLWKAYAVKLSSFFKADPGALYRVEFSFKKAYSTFQCEGEGGTNSESDENSNIADNSTSDKEAEAREERYWNNETYRWRETHYDWRHRNNPCYDYYYRPEHFATTNILGSDLGIIVKKGTNKSYRFITSNLLSAKPASGATVKLYDYQQQLIQKITTGEDGIRVFDSPKPIAFAVAQKGENYAYAKLDDGEALSMSKFDVSGKELQKGLKGFIYTERGVYRPGDSIHLTFVLNDKDNPLPKTVPVKLEVRNARGKLVQRSILSEGQSTSAASAQQQSSPSGEIKRGLGSFYYFPIPTKASDPTGNWNATISVGGADFSKSIKVATVKPNHLKIKLDFDDKILDASKPISGLLSGSWLHGAPARNLKAEMDVTLTSTGDAFPNFKNYTFTDPVRNFERTEIPVLKTKLSSEGKTRFSKKIDLDKKAPGMLKATFLSKLYEGGGDFSIDVFSKKLAPYAHFVGLESPQTHRYGSFYTDEDNRFDVVTVDARGKASGNRKVKVQVFRIEWRWWWHRGRDNLSKYEDATVHKPVKNIELTTNSNGKAHFNVNIPKEERGRYLIRVEDEQSGHAAGRTAYFYRNWSQSPGSTNAETAKMLVFSAEKKSYQVGEKAKVTFPSGSGGHALISIENGTEVLSTKWVKTQKGETEVEIPLTREMAPNIYVNISLLQPHDQVKNDLPVRLYGVIPIKVGDPNMILKPKITMPDVLKPNQDFTVNVSEKNDKAMTYTIAMVDEGLLDLTRFQTPDIHGAFYSREALGVKTFDIYDYVIGAYSGSVNNIYEIGGGGQAAGAKKHKANRFKPVVKYLGPFKLKPGQTAAHHIHIPNYIGAVRTMVVAGNQDKAAYGNAEKSTPVRKPLMVLASLPRKLSPGETVTLPVTVFAMENKVKDARIRVKTTGGLQAVDGDTKTVHFDEPGQKIVNFKYKVKPSDAVQKIAVNVSGNGEHASYDVEIGVVNPNPITQKTTDYKMGKNESKTVDYAPYGVAGTNQVSLELSTLPPMDFTKRLQFLINYPHGCLEQTTSSAFPQLFLKDIFDLTYQRKQKIQKNVKATIKRLGHFQLPNGGLSFWPGGTEASEWGTSYAGHFMLEAKQKGYALPLSFLDGWLRYQKNEARHWRIHQRSFNTSLEQAYRLYTLALAGQPELAAMNRLRESDAMSNNAKWRLAAAYALAGKNIVAKDIAQTANIDFRPHKYDYYTYGSPFRNEAMALETMVILGSDQQRELSVSLAKRLSSDRWLSTQETSYALLAMAKMVDKNGGKGLDLTIEQNGKTTKIKTSHAITERKLAAGTTKNSVKITNNKGNVVYATLSQEGKLALGKEMPQHKKLYLKTQYLDGNGKPLDVSSLRQGTEIEAKVTVTNTSSDWVDHIALSQIFPSGWEIVNTSFTALKGGAKGNANYTDIRDDRVNFYFSLDDGKSKTFSVKLNASYLGRYYLPGTQAEAMYDHSYYARNKGEWVQVKE